MSFPKDIERPVTVVVVAAVSVIDVALIIEAILQLAGIPEPVTYCPTTSPVVFVIPVTFMLVLVLPVITTSGVIDDTLAGMIFEPRTKNDIACPIIGFAPTANLTIFEPDMTHHIIVVSA